MDCKNCFRNCKRSAEQQDGICPNQVLKSDANVFAIGNGRYMRVISSYSTKYIPIPQEDADKFPDELVCWNLDKVYLVIRTKI